jgi:hypothetical protein
MSTTISLNIQNGTINAEILPQIEGAVYAFYVYFSNKKIFTKEYDTNTILRLRIHKLGLYRVEGFIRYPDGSRKKINHAPEILYSDYFDHHEQFKREYPTYSIEALDIAKTNNSAFTIHEGLFDFPVFWKIGAFDTLFVLLSAAIDRSKVSPPVFHRRTWVDKFPGNVVCIADPALSFNDDYSLGWYLGINEKDGMHDLKNLILRIAKKLNVKPSKIIIYGSSGGGFAALAVSSAIPYSTAVAINSQTLVTEYENRRSVRKMLEICFNGMSIQKTQEKYMSRISILEQYKSDLIKNRVILAQNKFDNHHFNIHYLPLCEILGINPNGGKSINGRHYSFLYEHPNGHGPEPDWLFPKLISLALEFSQDPANESTQIEKSNITNLDI